VFHFNAESVYAEGDGALQIAWSELALIEKEQEHYTELRAGTEQELETCRQKGAALENVKEIVIYNEMVWTEVPYTDARSDSSTKG
jgi:hypothetical protein